MEKVEARVEPAMIPVAHPMSNVDGVYNAAYIVETRQDRPYIMGKVQEVILRGVRR